MQLFCAGLKLLTYDSILFHYTSSSSLKHKRKDERKHKKRSVCDCRMGIMYSPNPTHVFLTPLPPPISFSSPTVSISTLFRSPMSEKESEMIWNRGAWWVNSETCSFFVQRLEKKTLQKENRLKAWATKRGKRGWKRVSETNFMLWSCNIL